MFSMFLNKIFNSIKIVLKVHIKYTFFGITDPPLSKTIVGLPTFIKSGLTDFHSLNCHTNVRYFETIVSGRHSSK